VKMGVWQSESANTETERAEHTRSMKAHLTITKFSALRPEEAPDPY